MKVPFKLAAVTLLVGTLSACAVGPNYQAPQQIKDVSFNTPYQQADLALNWWQAFDDTHLNQLIEKAIIENRTIIQARANIDRAYAVFNDADNNHLPKGTLDTGYQASENTTLSSADDNVITRGYNTGANLGWDIDLFGKIQRASEAAAANAQQADILWHDAQLQIISQVAISYGEYRGAQLRLKVAQENVSNLVQSRDVVVARLNAGMASELELARIDAQLYEVKASVPSHENNLQLADASLSALLAQQPGQLNLGTVKSLPQLKQPVAIVEGENYLRYRSDVASSERELAARSAEIGIATADLYPSVSVRGFLGFLSGPGLTLNGDTQSWSIAPALSWQAADLGSVRARINAANASERMAYANFEQHVFNAINMMESSIKSYNLSRQQELITQQQWQASHKAADIARKRYNAGSGEFLDLLDAERELLRSLDQQAQLEQQTFTRLVNIYREFGGGINVL